MQRVYNCQWEALAIEPDKISSNMTPQNSIPPSAVAKGSKIQRTATDDEKQEIAKIEDNLPPTPIEREQLVKVRLQQSEFRKRIVDKYNGKCVISGISEQALLIAGHIKPWSKSDEVEKLDRENGLLLSATYDKLFDKGYISFENNGTIIISNKLPVEDILILQIKEGQSYDIKQSDRMKEYLDYHRKEIFLK